MIIAMQCHLLQVNNKSARGKLMALIITEEQHRFGASILNFEKNCTQL